MSLAVPVPMVLWKMIVESVLHLEIALVYTVANSIPMEEKFKGIVINGKIIERSAEVFQITSLSTCHSSSWLCTLHIAAHAREAHGDVLMKHAQRLVKFTVMATMEPSMGKDMSMMEIVNIFLLRYVRLVMLFP